MASTGSHATRGNKKLRGGKGSYSIVGLTRLVTVNRSGAAAPDLFTGMGSMNLT